MNFQNTNKPLKVVLSVGDDSGIGPEIILKALHSNEIPENIEFKLVGSKKNLQNTYEHLRSLGLENLANPKNLKIQDIAISCIFKFLGFARFSNPKDLRCSYVFCRFFFDPTNLNSIFSGISLE